MSVGTVSDTGQTSLGEAVQCLAIDSVASNRWTGTPRRRSILPSALVIRSEAMCLVEKRDSSTSRLSDNVPV